jgi:shikimate kinase
METLVPGNIFLIGFSGTGKSTVGCCLAERLGWPFVDVDDLIVERFGKSIDRVFAEDGEACFRATEGDIITGQCRLAGRVLAVGGGAVVSATNREVMADGNRIVRLLASPETILRRLQSDGGEVRPMLSADDPLRRISELARARAPFYEMADCVVDTDGLDPDAVTSQIVLLLGLETGMGFGMETGMETS